MIKICCITYKMLDQLVKQAVQNIDDPEISIRIVEGLQEEIVDQVEREIIDGAQILLAGGANAKIARKRFNVPVLNYRISDFDMLTAIDKGYAMGEKVGIATYQTPMSEKLTSYLKSQGRRVVNLIYEDTEELKEEILQSGVDVVIGAAHSVEVGQELGRKTVLIYPGEQSILETIKESKVVAEEIRKVREQSMYANTVMQYTTNGVILVDGGERISDYNEIVRQILGIQGVSLRGKYVGDVLRDWNDDGFLQENIREKSRIISFDDREILEKIIKIDGSSQEFNGAVIILQKLNEIRRAQLEHEKRELEARRKHGFEARKKFEDIIGKSYQIRSCIEDAKVFAKSDASVLIYGETGVGKELFAQGLHNESARYKGPFIAVNCAALTETLLEAELFGYDEGAFTGSRKGGKKGLFELADGGTIFLDEIGEISPMMQARLLRVLQEHEIMRVGGEKIISVDVRVISATNRDLENIPHDVFRRDLLYRLNVLEIRIPSLREREKDGALLFEHFFAQQANPRYAKVRLPESVSDLIEEYSWPGNIREMQNVCQRFCLYLEQAVNLNEAAMKRCMVKALGEQRILQSVLQKYRFDGTDIPPQLVYELKDKLSYNRDKIAAVLGSSRTTIWRILKQSQDVSKTE